MGRYSTDSDSERGTYNRRRSRSRSSDYSSDYKKRKPKRSHHHKHRSSSHSRQSSHSHSRRRSSSRSRDHYSRKSYTRSKSRSPDRNKRHKRSRHQRRHHSSSPESERSGERSTSSSQSSLQKRGDGYIKGLDNSKQEKNFSPLNEKTKTNPSASIDLTESEVISRNRAIEEIEGDSFIQESFSSHRKEKSANATTANGNEEQFNFGTQAEINARKGGGTMIDVEDDLFSPYLFGDQEEREERYMKRLLLLRQKALLGELAY